MLKSKLFILLATFMALLVAASYFFSLERSNTQQLGVQLLWQNEALDCQTTFHAGESKETWFIEQLQFFISDIEFGSEKSGWQKANLVQTPFQAHDTVLLGTNCRAAKLQDTTSHAGNWAIEFEPNSMISDSSSIRFTLGVPFQRNHLNPISQDSPLNIPSMFWVWQTGHKFIRLEMANKNEQWLFHLGSTGCVSASVMRTPENTCRYPNVFTFELPVTNGNGNNLSMTFDLARLLANVELSSLSNCQSEQDIASCQQLFHNLSLNEKNTRTTTEKSVFKLIKTISTNKGMAVE